MRLIDTFSVETLNCSASQVAGLISKIKSDKKYECDSLREIWIDDRHLTKELVGEIRTYLCRKVMVSYGYAETGFICYASYDMIADISDAVGVVLPNVCVEILDDAERPVPLGKEGRVRCSTEYYSRLYAVNNSGGACESEGPWWYSGDFGRLTADGVLCISGRK